MHTHAHTQAPASEGPGPALGCRQEVCPGLLPETASDQRPQPPAPKCTRSPWLACGSLPSAFPWVRGRRVLGAPCLSWHSTGLCPPTRPAQAPAGGGQPDPHLTPAIAQGAGERPPASSLPRENHLTFQNSEALDRTEKRGSSPLVAINTPASPSKAISNRSQAASCRAL